MSTFSVLFMEECESGDGCGIESRWFWLDERHNQYMFRAIPPLEPTMPIAPNLLLKITFCGCCSAQPCSSNRYSCKKSAVWPVTRYVNVQAFITVIQQLLYSNFKGWSRSDWWLCWDEDHNSEGLQQISEWRLKMTTMMRVTNLIK